MNNVPMTWRGLFGQAPVRGLLAAVIIGTATFSAGQAGASDALKITIAGGSVGGAWSAIGSAVGEAIRRENPGTAFTYEPGRDAGNVLLVAGRRVEMGIAHAQMALRGTRGEEPFKAKIPNIRAISLIDSQAAVQILVREDFGAKTLAEIKEKKLPVRLALNQRGTMMAIIGEEIFKAAGISVNDITAWGGRVEYVAYNAGLDMMKNGQVDVILNMLAFPSGQIVNATREMKVRMVGLPPEIVAKINAEVGTSSITVPANTYPFQPEAVQTVNGKVVLLAAAEMPDETAGRIVNAMLKNFDYLQQSHATMKRVTKADLTDVGPVELHPGAAKAYRAAGLLK
jgi:TRAP transporter TAXI family solute receptor